MLQTDIGIAPVLLRLSLTVPPRILFILLWNALSPECVIRVGLTYGSSFVVYLPAHTFMVLRNLHPISVFEGCLLLLAYPLLRQQPERLWIDASQL